MRNLFIYEVIRYYPNIRGDEFFNIGIKLSDGTKRVKIEFIQEEHLSHIYRFPSIEKKVITSMLEQLKESESSLENWYGNYLKISSEKLHRSSESFEEVLNNLYEDFIGYKFHYKEKKDQLEVIRVQTESLISREFKAYLKVERDSKFDFVIFDKRDVKHFSDLGSINNKIHVNNMIWQREENIFHQQPENSKFDFLNISTTQTEVAEKLLFKNDVNLIPYDNDDVRYNYLHELVS